MDPSANKDGVVGPVGDDRTRKSRFPLAKDVITTDICQMYARYGGSWGRVLELWKIVWSDEMSVPSTLMGSSIGKSKFSLVMRA